MYKIGFAAIAAIAMSSSAYANSFTNGDFETGDASGWTQGGGYRGGLLNPSLNPSALIPGDSGVRSSIIVSGTVDPNVGAALGSTVYGGKYSFRVEDTTFGGYASVIQQKVTNYTDTNIFFAWKSVLLGAHGLGFSGVAKSVKFGGTLNQQVFDDLTFGSKVAGGGISEPAAWAMMLAGFGLVGSAMRRREKVAVTFA